MSVLGELFALVFRPGMERFRMHLIRRLGLGFLQLSCSACLVSAGDGLRLNQIQVIGSHNSYHVAPPAAVLDLIRGIRPEADAWNYTHPPLREQLAEHGLRQFELDVFADPEGGLFAKPLALRLAAMSGRKVPAWDPEGVMGKAGFKVLHVQDLDCWSRNPTLRSALEELREWSDANRSHLPLAVLVECKDQAHPPLPTRPVAFDRARMMELEKEIREVMPAERIFTPDELRGDAASLPAALAGRGWPAVDALRGRFLFLLDNTGALRDLYLEGNPALEGRLMFVSAPGPEHPAAAWFKRNDPVAQGREIRDLVERGFLVRTRTDSGKADPKQRAAAFASGAQWLSTDHFDAALAPEIRVRFEDGSTVRANPVTHPAGGAVKP